MSKTLRILTLVFLGLSLLVGPTVAQELSADSVWKEFRRSYPYHVQCVALTEPDSVGRRVMIVAEPPPHVTFNSLIAVAPSVLAHPVPRRQRIGFDGWVEDVTFVLPPLTSDDLKLMLENLQLHLYGTTYKSSILPLPAQHARVRQRSLDLRVPAGELGDWLLGDIAHPREGRSWSNTIALVLLSLWVLWCLAKVLSRTRKTRNFVSLALSLCLLFVTWIAGLSSSPHHPDMLRFYSVLGGESYTGRQILDGKLSGVFLSEEPGVVVWSFSRADSLEQHRLEARQFALDSDVVIGAVASAHQIAVLGRERSEPVDLLPPLRTETIFLLAAANSAELAQSYERTHILAGKFDGKHDWAPIYLSPILIDTEYGSLLNITDQILKSWSMHGLVRYINFNYPDPNKFPFDTDLPSMVNTSQVTFNWNTKGVGYTTKNNAYEVYALHRTGALPVDYLSADNSELQQAEENAYGYFSGLNDPNLVRVVQYASLYQIFRRFGITAHLPQSASTLPQNSGSPRSFRLPIALILAEIQSLSDDQIARMKIRAVASGGDGKLIADELDQISLMRDAIQELTATEGDAALRKLVDDLGAPRTAMLQLMALPPDQRSKTDENILNLVQLFQKHREVIQMLTGVNLAQVKDSFVAESARGTATWIRTPSIVLSWPEGKLAGQWVGGHNLDSKITQFRLDPDLAPGQLRVIQEDGQNVILHSPADADKAPELVRLAARNEEKSPSEIEDLLKRNLPQAQFEERPLADVLAFTSEARPAAGRGFQPSSVPPDLGSTGWKLTQQLVPERSTSLMKVLDSTSSHSVIVSRQASGSYFVAHGSSRVVIESSDLPSAVDAAVSCIRREGQGPSDVKLYLAGFEPRQGKGFAQSIEMNLGEEKLPKITATIEAEPLEPAEFSRILHDDYKLAEARVTAISAEDSRTVNVELSVPAKEIARPSLLVRIRILFEEGFAVTADALQSIRSALDSWQAALSTTRDHLDLLFMQKRILQDLKSVHPEIKSIDFNFSREGKDLFYGARDQDPEPGRRNPGQPV